MSVEIRDGKVAFFYRNTTTDEYTSWHNYLWRRRSHQDVAMHSILVWKYLLPATVSIVRETLFLVGNRIGGIAPNEVIARSEFEVHRQIVTEWM